MYRKAKIKQNLYWGVGATYAKEIIKAYMNGKITPPVQPEDVKEKRIKNGH